LQLLVPMVSLFVTKGQFIHVLAFIHMANQQYAYYLFFKLIVTYVTVAAPKEASGAIAE
jgi:hypothetical protein